MAKYVVSLSLIALMVALNIQTGEALTCYQCTSATNKNCGDPFMATGIATCTASYCSKGYVKSGDTKVVSRGCAPVKPFDGCEKSSDNAKACYCDSEKCNGGASVAVSAASMALAAASALYIFM